MFYDDGQIFRRCILIALILYSKYYHVKFSSLLRYIIVSPSIDGIKQYICFTMISVAICTITA